MALRIYTKKVNFFAILNLVLKFLYHSGKFGLVLSDERVPAATMMAWGRGWAACGPRVGHACSGGNALNDLL